MSSQIDKYSRLGLDVASVATSFGFTAAKVGTKIGFSITRGIASTAVGLTGSVVDYSLFGGRSFAGPILSSAVSSALSIVEQLTLAPILLSESLASTSFTAAFSSLNLLSTVFPDSQEASFSLASFVQLVRREWTDPAGKEALPEKRYSAVQVAKALMAWAALQGLTSQWQEKRWFKYLKEISPEQPISTAHPPAPRVRTNSRLQVTTDVTFSGRRGQIIAADIGEASNAGSSSAALPRGNESDSEIKLTLRRLSKLVLAGYGGASLAFFGISPSAFSPAANAKSDKSKLIDAVDASEAEPEVPSTAPTYSWWNMLMGRHDKEIFHIHAKESQDDSPVDATIGNQRDMPRFWVLCDHRRHQVVLVIRGTMSLNDLAVDLTCDPVEFVLPGNLASPVHLDTSDNRHPLGTTDKTLDEDEYAFINAEDILGAMPGSYPGFIDDDYTLDPLANGDCSPSELPLGDHSSYQVHGGIYKMAFAMGSIGRPVWMVVREALKNNNGYSLVLCGHSLGAGLSALLALMWADPKTCLTIHQSGLPEGRKVQCYLIAPPCIADAELSKLSSPLIHSFVYSKDVVSRLSLGSVRDMTLAASWLCEADEKGNGEGYAGIARRAIMTKAGYSGTNNADWFLSIRKTLEANMQMAHLYPPGRVWWALRNGDLDPLHQTSVADGDGRGKDNGRGMVRLFEVLDVEKVFGQIVFAGDMLSSHMPHQYDKILQTL